VRVDRVRLHTGAEIEYTYLETPAAVFVVPLLRDGRIVLIRQYRHPLREWVWEVPAGSIGDESPEETARRELEEEIGGTCEELIPLGWFYSSPAHLTLKSYPFLAVGVELGDSRPEETELLQVVPLPADEVLARVRTGGFGGGQSALSLLLAEPHIRERLAR
jgi:ADP-ribose pyrophosphatase